MANEKQFIAGMRYTTPSEKTPKWIKGHISVKVEEFIGFAQSHQDERGWLNIDVKESKGGNLYLELNEYRKGQKPTPTSYISSTGDALARPEREEGYGEEDVPWSPADLPF